ncbi:hypothetical protein AALH53_02610 [Limosilactobacillus reuteri]
MKQKSSLIFQEIDAKELYSSDTYYLIGSGFGFAAGMGLIYLAT